MKINRVALGLIFLGVIVHLAGFSVFRVVAEPASMPPPEHPFVSFPLQAEGGDPLVAELSALSDSEPLFLPTRWNASVPLVPNEPEGARRSPFDPFPPETTMGEGGGALFFQARPATPQNPKDVLAQSVRSVFESFGHGRAASVPRREAGLQVEIRDFYSDKLIDVRTLPYSDSALDGLQSRGFAEYHIQLQRGSLIGPPILATGTADEALDRTLGELLLQAKTLEDLPTGYYRVLIGP